MLTHLGRVTHICINKLAIIDSDNGLSPFWHQTIIWLNVGISLMESSGTNFSEIWNKIQQFSSENVVRKMAANLSQPQCVNNDCSPAWVQMLQQWCHMNVIASHLISNLTVQQLVQANNKENTKLHITGPLWGGINWWTVDFPHKRPLMQKVFSGHDIIIPLTLMIWNQRLSSWLIDQIFHSSKGYVLRLPQGIFVDQYVIPFMESDLISRIILFSD